ncbi:MAG: M15 family metallopeptidase [Bacteroidota bacterium]
MHRLSLLALFFGLACCANAQNAVPWSDEHALFVTQLSHSFVVPAREEERAPDTVDMWARWKTVGNYTFGKNRGDLPMICDLSALHPYFRDKVIELISICKSKGIELAVVETYRTVAKQNEYKHLGKIYTRSSGGRSKHQYGLAVDVVPVLDSVPSWHNEAVWKKIGLVGEKLGLRWGGRWRHPYDPGHFEWSGGVSGAAMEQGRTPKIPHPENYPCLSEDLDALQVYWDKWEEEQRGPLVARVKSK